MSLLDRLAHSRALDRLGPRGPSTVSPTPPRAPIGEPRRAVGLDGPAFERLERAFAIEPDDARSRGFAAARSPRSTVLGGCLERVHLPSAPALDRDLVCLGAREGGRAVFLDTETTGLGGVSVAYIVGLAFVDGSRLRCVQWTLQRCSGEAELLADVLAQLEALGPAPLVSFNGASFDLPLLRLRAHRFGLSARALDADHVDLLHPARRLQRGRGRDCKLATLERELLGVHRRGDIESAEIPEVFWSWLQAPGEVRAQRRLDAVREHNLVDLVSLPALAAWLGAALREPGDLDRALRAARHLDRVGAAEQARMVLSRWVEPDRGPSVGAPAAGHRARDQTGAWREAALELANLERRAGARERAAELCRAAHLADPGCPDASEAWAKILEHQLRDFAGALRVARGSRRPCARRIARLEARVARAASSSPRAPTPASAAPRLVALAPEPAIAPEPEPEPANPATPRPPAVIRPIHRELLARVDETEAGAVVRYRLLR